MKQRENTARLIARLKDIMERERRALDEFSVDRLSALHGKKHQFVSELEGHLSNLPPSDLDALQKDILQLRKLAARNLERLGIVKAALSEARKRLTAAATSQSTLGLYNVSGRYLEGPKSISVARSL